MLSCQISLGLLLLPPPSDLSDPTRDLVNPTTGDKNSTNGVDHTDNKRQEPAPLFTDKQQNWLNIILEEDTRNQVWGLGHLFRLASRRVLVREDRVTASAGGGRRRRTSVCIQGVSALGVESRHDGEEVLVFEVMLVGLGHGFIERIH